MYKFLNLERGKIKSESGDMVWRIGEWQHVNGAIVLCENGLHCSNTIYDAFSYVQGSVLAFVKTKGIHVDDKEKSAYSAMRIVKAYKWTKKDSISLAIFSAELCLKEFERLYPDDDRPRKAIDAARTVLAHDTAKNRSAARSAARSAESAARSAESAARSAARSAESAAESAARSAARSAESAARSAESAAWSAESAAWSAAWSAARSVWSTTEPATCPYRAAIKKIDTWFKKRIKELEEIK